MAGDCGIVRFPVTRVTFNDSTLWWRDLNSFWGAGPLLVNDELTYTLEDGYNCEKGEYEKAFLDSNVYLNRLRHFTGYSSHGVRIVDIAYNTLSSHNIGDVFKDEFLHWQQCGMLNLTPEEADSVADVLVNMINALNDNLDCWETEQFLVCDPPAGVPQQFVKWANEACASTSIEFPQRTPANNIVYENGRAQIPEHLRGERYFIFDMNGRILQKGLATETIDLPPTPSILKIGKEIFTP